MAEYHLRTIPTDPTRSASREAAAQAAWRLEELLGGASDVDVRFYDEITFIDPGQNFGTMGCPACLAELGTDWWSDRMDACHRTRFVDRRVVTPCCRSVTELNDLRYDFAAGFARMELLAQDPVRAFLDDVELAEVGTLLGAPVRQVRMAL